MAAAMPVLVVDLMRRWHPRIQHFLDRTNRNLAGRVAVLSFAFGFCLLLALWQGGQPSPTSGWRELGLLAEGPSLQRVTPRDSAELAKLFDAQGYTLERLQEGAAVPRLAVARLPRDIDSLSDVDARKALFLRSLLPLILKGNTEIARIRKRVVDLLNARVVGSLEAGDAIWLHRVADFYGAEPSDDADILSRIDLVPASLALAQAAQESGWGRSRFARNANALFGQRVWGDKGPGLAPRDAERDDFRVRAFPDLMSAVRTYLHNLNSHRAYQDLRDRRAQARALGGTANALHLAGSLTSYSEEGEVYVKALRSLINGNDLLALDGLRFEHLPKDS
ncbi:glucosaminidase domain-containing protein [Pelagibius sp.]|uniref:glucosaminidase domain-containing protein n=1 Tax=Pelagibius sp. TaxID=1931238 RepID=UPI003BB01523